MGNPHYALIMDSHAPNCRQCEYFQTTWDKSAPLGCKMFGFKTRQLPSVEVLATTGKQCHFFAAKASADGILRFPRPAAVLPDHCTFSITG